MWLHSKRWCNINFFCEKSKYQFVTYAGYEQWYALFVHNGASVMVGTFKSELEAAKAINMRCLEMGIPPKLPQLLANTHSANGKQPTRFIPTTRPSLPISDVYQPPLQKNSRKKRRRNDDPAEVPFEYKKIRKSQFHGIYYDPLTNRWRSNIVVGGKVLEESADVAPSSEFHLAMEIRKYFILLFLYA